MRAVVIHEFGPPTVLTLEDMPDPVANPAMLPRLPAILGYGVGGVVSSAGSPAQHALIGRG